MTHEELRDVLVRIVNERLPGEFRELTAGNLEMLERLLRHELNEAWFETREAAALSGDPRRV